ncbi:hypothetical protein C5S31_03980 [ANME-1 cluster archaeon GoMg2]|nr:hypothetical protein [ANME-1 cluster archaeon GoMg2]
MSKRRDFFIRLLLIIAIICCSANISWGQEEDSVNMSYPSSLPAKSEFSHEDILNHAQSSLDRSISILNSVATLMGVLVGLLTLIVVIGIALGFFEYRRWQEHREQAKKSAEESKRYADEAKKAAEEAKPIIERLKKTEKEMDTLREEAKHLPSLSEHFSEDQKNILDEYGKKIEFLEAFGVPLESEDYLNRGTDFYQRGKYDLALTAFDKAIELKPDFALAWTGRGLALGKLSRYDEAFTAFDKAIELKPEDGNIWYNEACIYSRKGDKENTLNSLSKATELDAKFKEMAKKDDDFKNLGDDEDFKRVVS